MIWEGYDCWWFRNLAPVDVVYPIICKVLFFLYIPGGCLGFLNHQPYHTVQITSALLWFSFQIFCPKKQCVVYCFYLDPPAGVPLMAGSWGENGAVISNLLGVFEKKHADWRVLVNTYITLKETYDYPSSHSHGSVAPIAPLETFLTSSRTTILITLPRISREVYGKTHTSQCGPLTIPPNLRQRPSKGPFADGIRMEYEKCFEQLREFWTQITP